MGNLSGKNVLVTGASSGFGRAIALAFAKAGAHVALVGRNQERLQAIITGAPKDSQLGALYASYMDEARLEQLDAAPLMADLARVDAIKSKTEFAKEMANSFSDFGATLFHALGVPPETRLGADGFTRPASAGQPVPDLFG